MYGFRKELSASPSPPPAAEKNLDNGEKEKEVVADLTLEEVQPVDVSNTNEEPPTVWDRISWSLTPYTVAPLRLLPLCTRSQKLSMWLSMPRPPSLQLRNEALQDFMKVMF